MGHYYECIHCGREKGHADDCPNNPNKQRTIQIQLSRQRAHDRVEAALSADRANRLTEEDAIRLAKVMNGPFDFDGFAAKAGHSIDELREHRWKTTPRGERMILIQQARAIYSYYLEKGRQLP